MTRVQRPVAEPQMATVVEAKDAVAVVLNKASRGCALQARMSFGFLGDGRAIRRTYDGPPRPMAYSRGTV